MVAAFSVCIYIIFKYDGVRMPKGCQYFANRMDFIQKTVYSHENNVQYKRIIL